MRKFGVLSVMCTLGMLVLAPAVFADMSPNRWVVIPEAIWAPASGGGTWSTSLQITCKNVGTQLNIQFFYQNTNSYRTVSMFTSSADHQTIRYSNILQYMGTIDSSFGYYGRVGTLLVYSLNDAHRVWAQALTSNGNYGKTYPSFVWKNTINTADVSRYNVIPGIQNTSIYRTGTGFWNSTSGTMDVNFYVMDPTGYASYAGFSRTLQPYGFLSFDPFIQAGISGGTYANTYLLVWPMAKSGTGEGLFCFGSLANNITNDTSALIAQPFQ